MERKERRIGDYVLIEKIGKGGQATVWKGLSPEGKEVAIKKMSIGSNIDNQKSYEREVAILKLVQHEYLVKNLACFREGDHCYLVYEYCPCDLLQFLQKQPNRQFPESSVKKWARQLCLVMISLNNLKIIHRDLKPENILLTKESLDGDVRLADFGLAKQGLTTLSFVGTLEYASPEIKNCQEYSYNTDVWSLGVIVFASIAGKLPIFRGNTLTYPDDINISATARDFLDYCLKFDYKIRPNFQQLILHEFLLEDRPEIEKRIERNNEEPDPQIIIPQNFRPKIPKLRNINYIERSLNKMTLVDDMIMFVTSLGDDIEFLVYFVSKHFTEKLQKIITSILDRDNSLDIQPEFMEYFFQQSEKICNIYSNLQNKYGGSTNDDYNAYSYQIDEVINNKRDTAQPTFLAILDKVKHRLTSHSI